MKKLAVLLLCSVFATSVYGQSFLEAYENTRHFEPFANANGTQTYDGLAGNPNEWSKVIGVFYEFDDIQLAKKGIDGSVFLYDSWNNNGSVYLDKKVFKLSNINYHVDRSSFMTKIENDSIFIFDFDLVDKIVVNKKTFKRFYHAKEGTHKVFEIVHQGKDFSLLKHYTVELVEGSPNPMLGRPRSKIKHNSRYYIEKKGVIQDFKLKKSSVLGLLDSDNATSMKSYMERYDLSYKKEADLQKAFVNIK